MVSKDVTVDYEAKPLEGSSTEDCTVWSVTKVYVNIRFMVKTDEHTAGFNVEPPYGKEVRVAIPHPSTDDSWEVPKGAIPLREFERQFERLADAITAYRSRILPAGF